MICKKCTNCGLCPGASGGEVDFRIVVSGEEIQDYAQVHNEFSDVKSFVPVGIALDLGTTTLAFTAYNLQNGRRLFFIGQPNSQRVFGADVISRICAASNSDGFKNLHNLICSQINSLVTQCFDSISLKFNKPCVLKKLFICGNTTMLNILCNIPVTGLAVYPFYAECNFGKKFNYYEIIGKNFYVKDDFEFYVPPVLSAFIGADFLCAVTYGRNLNSQKSFYLCDMGTNSEIGYFDSTVKKVIASSTSAGPCFEGANMECGSTAVPHAVSYIGVNENKSCFTKTLGGGEAESICGSGYLSALENFYKHGLVDENANIVSGKDEIFISFSYGKNRRLSVTQKDIRNLQLAKGAVESGIKFLINKYGKKSESGEIGEDGLKLYMAGGFGSSIQESSLFTLGVVPRFFSGKISMQGNMALKGLVELLFNDEFYSLLIETAQNSRCINLAEEEGYQDLFLNCLNFPPLIK